MRGILRKSKCSRVDTQFPRGYNVKEMDTEPKNTRQGSQVSEASKENPYETFSRTLETSKRIMDLLVNFATQNGVAPESFSHLTKVFGPDGHMLLPPVDVMRAELAKTQGQTDRTMRTRALTARTTGQVFVPEEQAGSVHDILHESVHRAVWLKDKELGLNTKTTNIAKQLAESLGVTISVDGRVDPESEYIKQSLRADEKKEDLVQLLTETLREGTSAVTEGLTEWTTQQAVGIAAAQGVVIEMASKDNAFEDEVRYIDECRSKFQKAEGLTDDRVDAKIIEAALSGDISELLPYL